MTSEDEIKKIKNLYIDDIYVTTRRQQLKDKEYIDDTFKPPIRHPHQVLRMGLGAEIVNSPAEHIVTSNPQAFVEVLTGNREAALRISKVINEWIDTLKRQNPNPFKEAVKNKLGRGENYIKYVHNETWVTKPVGKDKTGLPVFDKRGLPVLFIVPDPMVIYGSPEEEGNGIPHQIIVFYERQLSEVIVRYPHWSNPKSRSNKKTTEWLEYWDRNTMHFEADGEVIVHVLNPYGYVPFVRKYSGFGRRSPDGELAHLIVSDIRNSRGLIEEIAVMESDITSILHLSAHKPITIWSSGQLNKKDFEENLSLGEYDLNLMSNVPEGTKIMDAQIEQPTMEAFRHAANRMADLSRRHPFILAGFPWGTSGRQQSMADIAAMQRYDTVVENTETEWATAFEMAFKIMKAIPTLLPKGLHKSDIDVAFRCTVKLRAKDPIEEDRLITLGDRLRRLPNPSIDLETFHTQFMGYTQQESRQIMAKMLADMVTIYNPDVAAVMGMVAAEESGMEAWLTEAQRRRQTLEAQRGLEEIPPRTTQERIQGEVETPSGREMGTEGTRGARQPPARYIRGE